MIKKEEIKYRVIVSTNTFVENFDKELCAFVTGQIGECNIGSTRKFNAPAETREMFEKAMERRLNPDGYWRPVAPCENDSDSLEMYFKAEPTTEMLDAIRDGCIEFFDEKKEKNPITKKIVLTAIKIIKERSLYEETEKEYSFEPVTN